METEKYEDVPESKESKNVEFKEEKLCKIKVEENLINVECDKPLTMSLRSLDKKCDFKNLWYQFSGEKNPIQEDKHLIKPGRIEYLRCCKRCNKNFLATSKWGRVCFKCYKSNMGKYWKKRTINKYEK